MRARHTRPLVAAALLAVCCAATARAATPTATDFTSGITGGLIQGITAGPDGNLWFTEDVAKKVSAITPSGVVTEFGVSDGPLGITSGPDDRLWYAITPDFKSRIGRISATSSQGSQLEFPFREASEPRYITVGPDGNLWFTESAANRIGRMDPQGNLLNEIELPAGAQPEDITVGPDPGFSPGGSIWFTEFGGNRIGRIRLTSPCCILTEFATGISPGAGPEGITAGPDGNLWFTEFNKGAVARITPTGTVTEFPLGAGNTNPIGITMGQDGNLWVAICGAHEFGRVSIDGTLMGEFATESGGCPYDIAAGPDGNLWAGIYDLPPRIARINTALDPPAFRNAGQIAIPASGTDGPANPYPSTIAVSGLQGTVTDVDVRLTGISHTHPEHIDAVLVGPQGQTATLMSDVGSPKNGESPTFTSVPANGVTLNFDQEAQSPIPEQLPLLSGVYRPTDTPPIERTLEVPAPAPPPPYGTTLEAFNGTDANGTWRLFIVEDVQRPDRGAIFGGWGLDIQTTGPPPPATPPDTAAPETDITKQPKRKLKTKRRKAKVSFEFGASETGSTFECQLDSKGFEACASPATYKLKPGKHTFEVAAGDAVGNQDSSPATVRFKVVQR